MALAALVGAIGGLVIGRWIDFGHGGRVLWLSSAALMAMVAMRAASYGDPRLAIAANAVGALAFALHTPVVMTAVYNRSKLSPCPLRFHVATEAGWDLAGALLWLGAPYAAGIGLAALGVGASFWLLRRHYAAA